LTKAFVNEKKIPSVISILRNYDYLNEDYSKKANELFSKYHPIEIDSNISEEEKKEIMKKWWTEHFALLIKSGLNKSHLERIVNEEKIHFRESVSDFLDFLNKEDIPLIIISSSGVGDIIPILLKKQNRLYSNISLVTNLYKWNFIQMEF
jgi:HAD superfamily hydrolase (TIGR01544 family)